MSLLRSLYNNLFYWSFLIYKKSGGETGDAMALFFGIIYMSIYNSINLFTVFYLADILGLSSFNCIHNTPTIVAIILFCLINCVIFVRKKRYKAIVYLYDHLEKKKRILGIVIWFMYWILSVTLFIIVIRIARTSSCP